MIAELRERLAAECAERDLGPAARAELERLLAEGTADEIARVLRDLPPPVRAVDIVVDPEATAALARAHAEWEQRADAHRRRVVALGRQLGADVAAHRVTLEDAERRLDALAFTFDETVPVPLGILTHHVARDIARAAFKEGLGRVAT